MTIRFNLDPTISRVVIIGILMFAEALLVPVYSKLQQGVYPTEIEFITYLVSALLVIITFMLAFVKTGEVQTTTTTHP